MQKRGADLATKHRDHLDREFRQHGLPFACADAGHRLYHLGLLDLAQEAAQFHVTHTNSEDAAGFHLLAAIQLNAGRNEDAIASARQAHALYPDDASYESQADLPSAAFIATLAASRLHGPSDELDEVKRQMPLQTGEALTLELMTTVTATAEGVRSSTASLHRQLAMAEKVIAIVPNQACQCYAQLAYAYAASGRTREALAYVRSLLALPPSDNVVFGIHSAAMLPLVSVLCAGDGEDIEWAALRKSATANALPMAHEIFNGAGFVVALKSLCDRERELAARIDSFAARFTDPTQALPPAQERAQLTLDCAAFVREVNDLQPCARVLRERMTKALARVEKSNAAQVKIETAARLGALWQAWTAPPEILERKLIASIDHAFDDFAVDTPTQQEVDACLVRCLDIALGAAGLPGPTANVVLLALRNQMRTKLESKPDLAGLLEKPVHALIGMVDSTVIADILWPEPQGFGTT